MPPVPAVRQRLACNDCGAHSLSSGNLHHPGGECPVCESYEMVPVALVTAPRHPAMPFTALLAA
jgi:hypothetical protein